MEKRKPGAREAGLGAAGDEVAMTKRKRSLRLKHKAVNSGENQHQHQACAVIRRRLRREGQRYAASKTWQWRGGEGVASLEGFALNPLGDHVQCPVRLGLGHLQSHNNMAHRREARHSQAGTQ